MFCCDQQDTSRCPKENLSLKQRIKTIQIQSNTNRSVIPIRNKPPRTDAYGHKIVKGNKKHCVSFIDTIDKRTSIAEVFDISTQKKDNVIKYHINPLLNKKIENFNKEKNNEKVNCKACILF